MNVLLVGMSKRFYLARVRSGQKPPGDPAQIVPDHDWAGDVLDELARRGHTTTFARLDDAEFTAGISGGRDVHEFAQGRTRVVVTSRPSALHPLLSAADGILLRKDHIAHGAALREVDLGTRRVATILTSVARRGRPLAYRPRAADFTVLANDEAEVARIRRRGVEAEIFRKPAARLFYAPPADGTEKVFDVVHVVRRSQTARKRFPLFLASLAELDRRAGGPVAVAVVGDSSAHEAEIVALASHLGRVTITCLGKLSRESVVMVFHQSRTSVVTSRLDANPRTLSESLACDVPVACVSDISGGRFQIGPATGELCPPTPAGIASCLGEMLAGLDRYRPRANCVTIEESADQLERVLGGSARPFQG